jgi:hypothetical protein
VKAIYFAFACAALVVGSGAAFAAADDAKLVAQCVSDNKDEKASVEVISKYCTCMNNKMSDNETQSISTWEKTHKTEQEACSKQAGWK